MTFLLPAALLALLALPLIVLLHMMRERRRRVRVPSLILWQQLQTRREAQRRRRLPLTLLLLLHLLAAALIGLALAQPQVALELPGGERHLAVILDTSTSMAAPANASASRFEAALVRTRSLINSLRGRDRLTLISAGPHAQLLDQGDAGSAARLSAALTALQPIGVGSDIDGALLIAETMLADQVNPRIIILSDTALPELQIDTGRAPSLPFEWASIGEPQANRAIVNLAAESRSAGGTVQIYTRVVNYADELYRGELRLYGDDQLLDTRTIAMRAQGEVELTWSLPAGVSVLRAEIDGNDGLPADDTASLIPNQIRPINALLVSNKPEALQRALDAVPEVRLTVVDGFTYAGGSVPDTADLTIFDEYVPETWPGGGVLLINPGQETLADLVAVPVTPDESDASETIEEFQPVPSGIFDGISLGGIDFGQPLNLPVPPWADVLLAEEANPLIMRGRVAQSEVAIWAFDLEQSNLSTRLAFPLLIARSVRDLTPAALPGSTLAGASLLLQPDPRTDRLEIMLPDGTSLSPSARAGGNELQLNLDQVGIYTIEEYSGERLLASNQVPVNTGAARESQLRPLPPPSWPPVVLDETASGNQSDARPLWPWLVGAALIVLVIEWLYVHRRRSASSRQRESPA
jgi:Ca-activated chloride channel family protein